MRMRMRAAALALLLLAGCTGAEIVGDTAPPSAVAEEEPSADPHGELGCDEATLEGIDRTIAGQLDAFAVGDYSAALGFASERFRAGITPEQFQQVIEADYALLVGTSGYTPDTCVAQGDAAQILVTVDGADGVSDQFVYSMTREDGEWRIDVAGFAPDAASEEAVPV